MKLLITIALCLCLLACESRSSRMETYSAWCKLNHRTDLSFTEWNRLYDHHLLLGQENEEAKQAASAAAMSSGMAIGIAAGMSGGRR